MLKVSVDNTLTEEEVSKLLFDAAKGKAVKRKLKFDLRFNDVLRKVRRGYCERTGIPFDKRRGNELPFRASLDRINNTIGYVPSNIQVVVKIYNQAKFMWSDDQLLYLARCLLDKNNARNEPPNYGESYVPRPRLVGHSSAEIRK